MRDPSALTEDDIDEMVSMHRTDARIGGSWPPACGALLLACFFGTSGRLWINLPGAISDRLGSRLLGGPLGGVAFESAPVVLPGVRARNRGEGWVMAARKAREGYGSGPR
jgi:hypothetical protein